jgi:preprotein translocase subunit SecD
MFAMSRWKSCLIIFICLIGIVLTLPNFCSQKTLQTWPEWLQNRVNLGLDLQGGSHLQFEVDLKAVEHDHLNNLLSQVRAQLRKQQIGYAHLKLGDDAQHPSLQMVLRKPDVDRAAFMKLMRTVDADLSVTFGEHGTVVLAIDLEHANRRNLQVLEQSIEVIRRRIDESGTKEPTIIRQGANRIVVQLPGIDDPASVKKMIGKTAKLEFRVVDGHAFDGDGEKPTLASGVEWVEYLDQRIEGKKQWLPVRREVLLTGEHLVDAQATQDSNNGQAVSIRFDSLGARIFHELSTKYVHHRLAIVLDHQILTAPNLNEPIPNGSASITGSFSLKEAHDLALLLRAGALPAPLKVIEERTVGPSLGADSIHHGKQATIYAFILVATFMILGYSLFGLFANIALIFNLVLLFAGLSLLSATLTLPGIAGIAMTIGMAVDANVLIYERIKEEIRRGLRPHQAIEAGYQRAMSTIVDSNLTTLIGAAVLYEFGSGSIRGFAVTLALGILVSMFTALSVTKLITAWWFRNKKTLQTLPI